MYKKSFLRYTIKTSLSHYTFCPAQIAALSLAWSCCGTDRMALMLGIVLHAITAAMARPAHPHIVMVMGDDIGFANVGWNRAVPTAEVQVRIVITQHALSKACRHTCCLVLQLLLPQYNLLFEFVVGWRLRTVQNCTHSVRFRSTSTYMRCDSPQHSSTGHGVLVHSACCCV